MVAITSPKIIAALGCIGLFWIVHSAPVAASDGVVMTLSGPNLVLPKAFPAVVFTLTNTGTVTDTFDLRLALPQDWSSISSLKSITLKPGETRKKTITIAVPSTAESHKRYAITLLAVSTSDANIRASAATAIAVESVLGLKLTPEPSPELAWAGETITYRFAIQNLGNGNDVFQIEAHSGLEWDIKISPAQIPLEPSQSTVVQVFLKTPSDIPQEQLHVLSLRVFSVTGIAQGKDIAEEVKIRLKTIAVIAQKAKTYRELPGSMELETTMLPGATQHTSEIKLRFDTGGDLTEEYYAYAHFDDTFFGEKGPAFKNYRFLLGKKEGWNMTLGQINTAFTRLTEDLHGEGLSVRTFGKRFETRFFAGYNDEDADHDAYAVGANMTALLGQTGSIGCTAIFNDGQGSAENKHLYSLLGAYQPWEPLTLSGEIAYGVANTRIGKKEGLAWITGVDVTWGNLAVRGESYRAETAYPGSLTDKEGFNVYASYRLFRPLSVWLKYDRYHDNPDHGLTQLTTNTEKMSSGLYVLYKTWPTMNLTWAQEQVKSHEFTSLEAQNSLEESLALELYKSFEYLTLSARGKWGANNDRLAENKANISEYTVTVDGHLNMLNWSVSYKHDNRLPQHAGNRERTDKMEYALHGRLFNRVNARVGYTDEVTGSNAHETRKQAYDVVVDLAQAVRLGKNQSLDLKFEMNQRAENQDRAWRIGLIWKMNFATPIPWIKTKGRIRGQLFLDEDDNGSQGPTEVGYPKIKLTVNHMSVYTDENGRFEFPVIDPGAYLLDVDLSQLPSGIIPALRLPHQITLKKGEERVIDILLRQIGTIQGRVFEDKNKDTHENPDEDGLTPIRIMLLQDGKEIQEAFTDQQGRYLITDIPPGVYVVKLDQEYLPRLYVMTTPDSVNLSIKSKEHLTGIDFGVYQEPRKIIKTFFKEKQ